MLDTLFEQARAEVPELSAGLSAAMISDARAALPVTMPRSFWQFIGGVRGASGLALATLVGLWIGVVPLADSASWADPLVAFSDTGDAEEDLAWSDFGWILDEG